jgi:hypothetical protein
MHCEKILLDGWVIICVCGAVCLTHLLCVSPYLSTTRSHITSTEALHSIPEKSMTQTNHITCHVENSSQPHHHVTRNETVFAQQKTRLVRPSENEPQKSCGFAARRDKARQTARQGSCVHTKKRGVTVDGIHHQFDPNKDFSCLLRSRATISKFEFPRGQNAAPTRGSRSAQVGVGRG